ncbi:MAG: excinuclease ABC subunit UvrC [Bacteroidota bacterium]
MQSQKFSTDEYLMLPHQPGVYKFFDSKNIIIYVGKAKDLAKRVSSYFNKTAQSNRKTFRLVNEIKSIEVVLVNSEFDALLLENSLIKEHQPRYNILLKDDKSFPSICVTNERFPRVYSTRRIIRSKGDYYGPYTSVKAMDGVLDLLRKLYKIRTCNYVLSEENIRKRKFKVCLEYHIGNCLGPCEGLQHEVGYLEDIKNAREVLKGNISVVKNNFLKRMNEAAQELKFETAQDYKNRLDLLDKFQTKSLIVNQKITDVDVVGILTMEQKIFINYMKIQHGAIRVSETVETTIKMDEPLDELLQVVLFNLRKKYDSESPEILSNHNILSWEGVTVTIPQIGDKKKLVDLSIKNALFYKNDKAKRIESAKPYATKVLEQLQSDLRLTDLPVHIECFDNSNIQGTNPVASMVCFRNGKPSKKDYRKFNIKTVEGPNDFASMKEVVGRRYYKLKKENIALPNLIIVDGGKGQLSSAVEALKELDIYGKVPIVGIAKKLEEIYYPEDQIPLHISKKSPSLKLLQHLRDEAHRFAITFHRLKRSKSSVKSELDEIPGIGPKTKQLLLSEFKSVKRIKELGVTALSELIGLGKAKIIKDYFAAEVASNKKGDQ